MSTAKLFIILCFSTVIVVVLGQINKHCEISKSFDNNGYYVGDLSFNYNNESLLKIVVDGFLVGRNYSNTNLAVKLLTRPQQISSTVELRISIPIKNVTPEITRIEFNEQIYCNYSTESDSRDITRVRSNSVFNLKNDCDLKHRDEILEQSEFPWLATIFILNQDNLILLCRGTLISKHHVITVAHCIKSYRPEKLVVVIGPTDIKQWITIPPVSKGLEIIKHPDARNKQADGNLAIVRLEESIISQPIDLWKGDNDLSLINGLKSIAFVQYDQQFIVPWFKKATLPVISNEECSQSSIYLADLVSNRTFCAGGDIASPTPCRGDAGGGAFIKQGSQYNLRGIISYRDTPADSTTCDGNDFILMVDVAKYSDWIQNIINS